MEKQIAKNDESAKVKVVLKCGRDSLSGYSGAGCGNCEANTNNSGKATCC